MTQKTQDYDEPLPYTVSQLNGVGDRIRRAVASGGAVSPADRRLLEGYRAWHYPALRHAHGRLKRIVRQTFELGTPPTVEVAARPLKTNAAITAKLVREQTRLSKMQDIAGARIRVPNLARQDLALEMVLHRFENCEPRVVKDTREEADRYGYRAVHVVVVLQQRHVEIQIRTVLQDGWAQIVEKLDDIIGSDLKHGRGPAEWLEWLHRASDELRKGDLGQPFLMPTNPWDAPDTE